MTERREMIDVDELKKILEDVVRNSQHCQFPEAERTAIHQLAQLDTNALTKLVKMYDDATNNLWKGFLGLIALGAMVLAGFGAYFKLKGH